MKHRKYQMNKNNRLAAKLIFSTLLLATTSVSAAEDSDLAYVDSVLKWGAWELDIEPAAGGLSAPTTKALNTRSSKVALRTNSIAALAPPPAALAPPPAAPNHPIKPGIPVTPVPTPVIPTSPVKPFVPAAPTNPAPPGATPPIVVTLPAPTAPTSFAPPGATPPTVVTLP